MFNEQIKETVNNMIDQTLADEVRNQIRPDSLLPVDTLVPSVPQSTASVTTVMDNNELQVSVVRLFLFTLLSRKQTLTWVLFFS